MTTAKRLLGLVGMLGALAVLPVQAQTEVVLHSFAKSTGRYPYGGVIRDSAGNLYGTTTYGGANGSGVVYNLDTAGQYTVRYAFTGGIDGGYPLAGLIRDSRGDLYGTTELGGTAHAGVVFKLDATGHETVLYTFSGGADGRYPCASLVRDSVGNLYGTTDQGGTAGYGVVYTVNPAGQEKVLYSFTGGADGGSPSYAGVVRDSSGNLYGATIQGGSSGVGVVYTIDTAGTETVLYSFTDGDDGAYPYGSLIRDSSGNLYGVAHSGGATNGGVVFKVDTTGNEEVLYNLAGGVDGYYPEGGVIRDPKGKLYGATLGGGKNNLGAIFEIKP